MGSSATERAPSPASSAFWALVAGGCWGGPVALVLGVSPWVCMSTAAVVSAVVLWAVFVLRRGWLWPHLVAATCGVLATAAPLALFAQALKSGTHHRPLGAATFATIAVGLVGVSVVSFVRAGVLLRQQPWAPAVRISAAVLAGVSSVIALHRAGAAGWGWSIDWLWGAIVLVAIARTSRNEAVARAAERVALPGLGGLAIVTMGAAWLVRSHASDEPSAICVALLSAVLSG